MQHLPQPRQRPRTLVHPGIPSPIRINSRRAPSARHFRILLAPGLSLIEAFVEALRPLDVKSASATLIGGSFSPLVYFVGRKDESKRALFTYSAPINAGSSRMLSGSATFGTALSGDPIVHCHATFLTEIADVRGGHIVPEQSIVDAPITLLVTSLDAFEVRQAHDPETNVPLLQPFEVQS